MSKELLEHRGYLGSIEHDLESGLLFGSVQFVNDILLYEAETLRELEQAFQNSVDEYLDTCEEIGKDPDKPYKGTFNVRIEPELHRQLAQRAFREDKTLNTCVSEAIENFVGPSQVIHKHVHNHSISITLPYESRPAFEPKTDLKLVS